MAKSKSKAPLSFSSTYKAVYPLFIDPTCKFNMSTDYEASSIVNVPFYNQTESFVNLCFSEYLNAKGYNLSKI